MPLILGFLLGVAAGYPWKPNPESVYKNAMYQGSMRVYIHDLPEDSKLNASEITKHYGACWSDPTDHVERLYCTDPLEL